MICIDENIIIVLLWKGGKPSMDDIPLIVRKLGLGKRAAIPEQYRGELLKELIDVNIRREKILSYALIVIVGIIEYVSSFV
jgi:hypothetical protein